MTVNVAEVAPTGITTDAGTEATLGLELVKVTESPPGAVMPCMVTVPTTAVEDPPTTDVG